MQPGDPRRGLEVADVRLHRRQRHRSGRGRRRPEHRGERLDLDRVAERGARCRAPRRRPICSGRTRPSARARRMTSCWARPLGALIAVERPSWLTAVPRMTARTGSPSASASGEPLEHDDRRALAAHEAVGRASNALQRPSGAITPHFAMATVGSGESTRLTPPARARSQSPLRRLWHGEVHARRATTSRPCRRRRSGRAGRAGTTAGWR